MGNANKNWGHPNASGSWSLTRCKKRLRNIRCTLTFRYCGVDETNRAKEYVCTFKYKPKVHFHIKRVLDLARKWPLR